MTKELQETVAYMVSLGWEKTFHNYGIQHFRIGRHVVRVETTATDHVVLWDKGVSTQLQRFGWKETLHEWTNRAKLELVHNA